MKQVQEQKDTIMYVNAFIFFVFLQFHNISKTRFFGGPYMLVSIYIDVYMNQNVRMCYQKACVHSGTSVACKYFKWHDVYLQGTTPEWRQKLVNRAKCEYKMLQVFVSFFAFIKYLKVRLFCIKDYKEVLQGKKCCSEAAGYSPWSVPALLQSLGWKLQILAPSSRVLGRSGRYLCRAGRSCCAKLHSPADSL